MQRRKENTSRFDFRTRSMVWRVEWAFPSADGAPHVADARVVSAGTSARLWH